MLIDGLTVAVTRKPIKNMYLRIKPPNGDVMVSAPLRASDAAIADFVRGRRSWIDRNRQRMREAREHSVTYGAGDAGTSQQSGGFVWSEAARNQAAANINAQLPALLNKWQPVIGRAPTRITLRVMSTRWGSCTPSTGRIRLNVQLGLMPPQFLEYVLVHEMTHLWEHGHGSGFQRRMTQYLPNWKRLRRELNRCVVL